MMARYLFVFIFLLLNSGCERATVHFKNIDITDNTSFANDFSLLDSHGQTKHLRDFRGKVALLFFGYTQCPDVCPTILAEMREVMGLLGKDADKLQVIFVTLDPERDTADLLAQYVPNFHPSFIGLRPADMVALKKITQEFKIYYSKVKEKEANRYLIDHTAGSYVFDAQGKLRLFVQHGQGANILADDLRTLIKQERGDDWICLSSMKNLWTTAMHHMQIKKTS